MGPSPLNPGDAVIALAGQLVSASVFSGAINSSIVMWKYNHAWGHSLAAFIIGAILCWFIAKNIGPFVFPTQKEGDVFVVKVGASALPLTLKAAIIGSIIALIVCGYTFALILGGSALIASTWLIVTIVSLIVGGLWGILSVLV